MLHFGLLCPPAHGHLNPFLVLARAIQRKGHRVTVFNLADIRQRVEKAEVRFFEIGAEHYPLGTLNERLYKPLEGAPEPVMRKVWNDFGMELAQNTVNELLMAIQQEGVDFLLVDQVELLGGSLAEYLQIPYITICNAAHTNWEPGVPPIYTGMTYGTDEQSHKMNRWAYGHLLAYFRPVHDLINQYRQRWQLPPFDPTTNPYVASPLAQISQMPAAFDFPNRQIEGHFVHAGPFRESGPEPDSGFPYERLDGRPLVYVSMGTLVNGKIDLFEAIAEACAPLHCQVIIAAGATPVEQLNLAGDPIVVQFAPQRALFKQVQLLITHAGLNTVLDALSEGIPMVALPVSFEQPGLAERIRWHGLGELIPPPRRTVANLREAIQKVLEQPQYRANARRVQAQVAPKNGAEIAVNTILQIALNRLTPGVEHGIMPEQIMVDHQFM